jgi:hypothetical protein
VEDINMSNNSNQKFLITKEGDSLSIDFKPIWFFFKKKIHILTILVIAMFLLGILVAILSPVEYEASIRLLRENPEQGGSNQQNFMRNFNIPMLGGSGSANEMSSTLYPDIIESTPFALDLIQNKINFHRLDTSMLIEEYFGEVLGPTAIDKIKNNTIYLPSRILSGLEEKPSDLPVSLAAPAMGSASNSLENMAQLPPPLKISRKQLGIISQVTSRIELEISGSYVDIQCKMPDPVAAAELTQLVYIHLTDYIIKNKIRKASIYKNFIEERTIEAKEKFYSAQNRLAVFQDQNININTAKANAEEQKLKAEYELAFNLYKSLDVQLEQAKIKVKEDTPIFSVMEPIQIPNEKSEPQRMKIVLMSAFLGVFLGFVVLAGLFLNNNYKYLISLK